MYLDDAAVHELIKAMPTLALRNVWLPCGGWYPVLQDGEEVVIRATSGMSLNNPVFDARGKSFARANQRGGTQVKPFKQVAKYFCNLSENRHTSSTP